MSQRSKRPSGNHPPGRRPKDLRRGPATTGQAKGGHQVPRSAIGRSRVSPARTSGSFDPRFVAGAAGMIVLLVAAYILTGGLAGGTTSPSASPAGTPYVPVARASNPPGCPSAQPSPEPSGVTPTVTINTAKGAIVIKADGSPIATGNFVALAQCGFYNGLVFHRTAAQQDGTPFVIQGGDPNGDGTGGPGYSIQDEVVTGTFKRGTVAMARSSQPNSQGSQFFIVLDDSAASILQSANPGYAIVGEVTSGMDVADSIFQASNGAELPTNPIAMTSVTVSPEGAAPSSEAASPSPEETP